MEGKKMIKGIQQILEGAPIGCLNVFRKGCEVKKAEKV